MNELELIESAKTKKVLFCGERIIDVYHYVAPLGRPTKDAIVSVELQSSQTFEGGVLAARAHASDFCEAYVYCGGVATQKSRFVESSHVRKLFEYYSTTSAGALTGGAFDTLPPLGDFDAVIVTDYGHGMADQAFIAQLSQAKYLAVNVQTNAGNYGYNLATKYQHAHYLCVDESEARLATQNRSGPIEHSLLSLAGIADKVVITLGKAGATGYDNAAGDVVSVSAFTDKVVDTIGAGDAFFALTAILAEHCDMGSLLRIGNAAGALKTGIVGHQRSVTKHELTRLLNKVSLRPDASLAQRRGQRRAV